MLFVKAPKRLFASVSLGLEGIFRCGPTVDLFSIFVEHWGLSGGSSVLWSLVRADLARLQTLLQELDTPAFDLPCSLLQQMTVIMIIVKTRAALRCLAEGKKKNNCVRLSVASCYARLLYTTPQCRLMEWDKTGRVITCKPHRRFKKSE